jgi:hypothetical protein
VTLSKRGQATKVDEKWMTPCNQEGMSPYQNSARLNMRTISTRQREHLQKKADERHGFELADKDAKMRELTDQLEVEENEHLLQKQAQLLRGENQRKKDKEALQEAECNGERLHNLILVAELTQKRLERQLNQQTKEGEAAEGRCDGLAVAMASLQVKYDAKCGEFNGMIATNKRLERHLSLRTSEAEAAVVRCDGLTQASNSLQEEFDAKCVQFTDCEAKFKDAEKELTRVRGALAAKGKEVQQVNLRFTTWKSHADKKKKPSEKRKNRKPHGRWQTT